MFGLLLLAPLVDLWATAGTGGGYQHGFNVWVLDHAGISADSPLAPALRAVRLLGSPWTIGALRAATILALIFYKRWQHLVAFLASILVVGGIVSVTAGTGVPQLPAMVSTELNSSRAVAGLTVTLIGIAYSVASAGRPRKIVLATASALIALLGLAEDRWVSPPHPPCWWR